MLFAQSDLVPYSVQEIIPQIGPWVTSLGTAPATVFIQNWFAQIEVFHIVGLFMLGGATILTSLRLIGVGLIEAPPSMVERQTRLWFDIGVVMAIGSGLLIGLSNAEKLYNNSAFLFKMLAMIAGVIFSYFVLRPVAKADGEVGAGAKIGLVAAALIWLFSLAVLVGNPGSDVGAFHIMFAGALIAFAALTGALRWILVGGLAAIFAVWNVLTHVVIRANEANMAAYDNTNKTFMWLTAAFILGLILLNIFGKNGKRDSSALAKLIGYATILVWVTVGAGGRWIGLT